LLDATVPDGVVITSDGATQQKYHQLTGYSQQRLKDNWAKGGQLTGCNAFTGWYSKQLKPNGVELSNFDVPKALRQAGRPEAWIPSTAHNRPREGDILRHTAFHMDICVGFEGDVLVRAAAGQGGKAVGHDIITRVRGTHAYNPANLMGWVDIDIYLAEAAPVGMEWLVGWWKVWDGNYYYYYFYPTGAVQYTRTKPAVRTPPPASPMNRGRYSYSTPNLTIEWNPLDAGPTIETFRNAFPGSLQMNATSNRYSPLVATRIR
jgi:hypothetical protein